MADRAIIDIHSHILPGWDNGLPTLEQAVAAADAAAREGVRAIIVTPGVRDRDDAFDKATAVRESSWWLQDLIDEAKIPVTLFPGAQLLLGRYLPGAVKRGAPVTLAATGRYVLVDLPGDALAPSLRLLEALTPAGVTPVLAHPERIPAFQADPQSLRALTDRVALVQINASSLLPGSASAEGDSARAFLSLGLVHFIASDTHCGNGPGPSLLEAVKAAAGVVGDDEAWSLVTTNPDCVLRGQPLAAHEAVTPPIPSEA